MPFVQRENISHFLRACELPPLGLPAHDRFLTVDLYDNKDPAQVIQCISAFSRAANAANPSQFANVIGPKKPAPARGHVYGNSVDSAGHGRPRGFSGASQASESPAARALSPAQTGGSTTSRTTDASSRQAAVSSWSKRGDEGMTAPAWNIHQYGYMGGASQGNQGISFGARRQITSPSVQVPSLAEKERRRREQDEEVERTRKEQDDARRQQQERDQLDQEQLWEAESRKTRQKQKEELDRQRRQWEEEERAWKEEEERRKREEDLATQALPTTPVAGNLKWLDNKSSPKTPDTPENTRIKDLERQLEEARERERQYQAERKQRPVPVPPPKPTIRKSSQQVLPPNATTPAPATAPVPMPGRAPAPAPAPALAQQIAHVPPPPPQEDERDLLKQEWNKQQATPDLLAAARAELYYPTPENQPSTPLQQTPSNTTVPRSLRPGSPMRAPKQPIPEPEIEHEPELEPDLEQEPEAELEHEPEPEFEHEPEPEPQFPPTSNGHGTTADEPDSPIAAEQSVPPSSAQPYRPYSPAPPSVASTSTATSTPTTFPTGPRNPTAFSTGPRAPSPYKRPAPVSVPFSFTPSFAPEVSMSSTAEQAGEDTRRAESQRATKAGGVASRSLMEREMEMERERQREWESCLLYTSPSPRD